MNRLIFTLAYAALLAVLGSAVFVVLGDALSLPVVEYSYSSGECVRVIGPTLYTCDNLPRRYQHVWVR